MLTLLILKAAWLSFPFAAAMAWLLVRRRGWTRWPAALLLLLTGAFIWARYIEPRELQVHRETILLPGATAASPSIRVALFSDTHLGLFPNAVPMDRIVQRINSEGVDVALLAGDITYHPPPKQVDRLLAPLSDLNAPLFAVLGNHDIDLPGAPHLSRTILAALDKAGAVIVQNRAFETTLGGHDIVVAGASDLWQHQQDFGFSAGLPEGVPVLLLTHNPDTALSVPDDFDYSLMLAGHTHGGQIRIPLLYHRMIPTQWPFDKGLYTFPSHAGSRLVYVTSGTGMSGLPLRFLMPPRIDVLTLHLPE